MDKTFEEFARDHFARLGWLERSGAFIYTSPDSLRLGRTLIIATNPGGSVEAHSDQTLDKSLTHFGNRPPGWSAWFDEGDWGSERTHSAPGSAPLQKDVAKVLALLGHPADEGRRVCSTELIFLRSRDTGKLEGDFNEVAEACWPINERILREVQPSQLMIIGNSEAKSPWRFLRDKFCSTWLARPSAAYGRATARLKAADFLFEGRSIAAIGFPHFSRFGVPSDLGPRLAQLGLRSQLQSD
jgi:hypothetical protein